MHNLPDAVSDYVRWQSGAYALARRLVDAGARGVFEKYLAEASEETLKRFFAELESLDIDETLRHRACLLGPAECEPADIAPLEPRIAGEDSDKFAALGRESLGRGEWAVLVFAGGAGTRFFAGTDCRVTAKGLFGITPVADRSFLDQFLAETLAAGFAAGRLPYLVLMTSGLTHDELAAWREGPLPQGFPRERILLLRQADRPRLDSDGDLIAGPDGSVVRTGDGHGGVFRALLSSGMAARLQSEGVRHVVLHNVDNIAARALEPTRLGFHLDGRYALTLTAVERKPGERVGIICRNARTGRVEVFEYSACPQAICDSLDDEGRLRFPLAHINTNLVQLAGLRADLPSTIYRGKRCAVGERELDTSTWEMLNQHLSTLLDGRSVGVLSVERERFFLPTKAISGDDSVQTSVGALTRAGAARLESLGAKVDPTAAVEIDPCLGNSPGIISASGWRIEAQARLYLGCRGPKFGSGLVLARGAELRVSADRPWGEPRVDRSGALRAEPGSAPQVRIGSDVRIEAGTKVTIRIAGNGTCLVPEGYVFQRDADIKVAPGARADITR